MESNVDMEELQYQAFQELEEIVNSCDDIDTLIDAIFEWQTKYRIVDIEMFFVDEELAIKAKNLLSKAFEKFKEKQEAEQVLVHSLQKKTFLRLYDICSDFNQLNKKFKIAASRRKAKEGRDFRLYNSENVFVVYKGSGFKIRKLKK